MKLMNKIMEMNTTKSVDKREYLLVFSIIEGLDAITI